MPNSDGNEARGMFALLRRQHLDVILAADVADDDAVGPPVEVRGPEAFEHRDALLCSWVDIGG